MQQKKRHLLYTLALDLPGQTGHRNLAKMLVSSLLRTRFSGDIVVFRNSPAPLFLVARAGLREVQVEVAATDAKQVGAKDNDARFYFQAQSSKHAVLEHLDPSGYDKIVFIDCDAIALRNIDALLEGDWSLAYYLERGTQVQQPPYGEYLTLAERTELVQEGINSGTWAVASSHFHELMQRWREVEARPPEQRGSFREQSSFNRVVLDWAGGAVAWPQDEIALPLCTPNLTSYHHYSRSTIVHAAGESVDYKLRFLWSVFAGRFLWDPQLVLLNVMEM